MKNYTFDVDIRASFTISAESQEEAERIIAQFGDCDGVLLSIPEDELEGEASFNGSPTLAQINGKDVP